MKLRQLAIVGTVTSLLFITPLTVLALEDEDKSTDSDTSQTTDEQTDKETLRQHILEHKREFKVKLSEFESMHLKTRCLFAQGRVEKHHHVLGERGLKRAQAYGQLDKHLESIIEKLKARNIDTTELEQERAVLSEKAGKIKADFAAYKQDLADLKDMQCKSDPEGFKAALEAAREMHKTVVKDIIELRTYVRETVIPTLHELRKEVKDKESSEEQ